MPIQLETDFLSLDLNQQEIEIPVDALDRTKGTVHVTVRELPYATKRAAEYRALASAQALSRASSGLANLGVNKEVEPASLDQAGLALASRRAAQRELIRWGVVEHRAEDFLIKGQPTPFEAISQSLAGVSYQVASPRMLRLYELASPSRLFESGSVFFSLLADAVQRFGEGRILLPEEIWSAAEKELVAEKATAASEPTAGSPTPTSEPLASDPPAPINDPA